MLNLPNVQVSRIPPQRRATNATDLQQFILDDQQFWHEQARAWVQETARRGHDEIVRAGNPKFHISEVNGTTGKSGNQRRGFTPGSIDMARTSVRVLYQADELAKVANSLRPILTSAIHQRFPNSKMKRLERDGVWYVVRDRQLDASGGPEYLGGSVTSGIGVYDVLYLVPDKKYPADYAWFANWLGKHGERKAAANRRSRVHWSQRKVEKRNRRQQGFMATAANAMRGRRLPGVAISATFLETAMGASYSRVKKHKGRLPAIRVAFYPLRTAVTN
jgi:hypothetical protein